MSIESTVASIITTYGWLILIIFLVPLVKVTRDLAVMRKKLSLVLALYVADYEILSLTLQKNNQYFDSLEKIYQEENPEIAKDKGKLHEPTKKGEFYG